VHGQHVAAGSGAFVLSGLADFHGTRGYGRWMKCRTEEFWWLLSLNRILFPIAMVLNWNVEMKK
jgi:hypothetical protein